VRPADPFVVEVVRGGLIESTHVIDVAVVEGDNVRMSSGDPDRVAYWRSSLKPVQAAVSLSLGWKPGDDEEVAVASASHEGSPRHVEVVARMLAGAGLDAGALRCPAALPFSETAAAAARGPAAIYHNCSGKHAAFLATCVANSWPLDSSLDASHPLQQAVAARTRGLTGGEWGAATDGCGAVTLAAPLVRMAQAFLRNATDEKGVSAAMRAHPFLVAGAGRLDTDLMSASEGLVTKAGAEGLFCFAHPSDGVAGALKCRDGSPRAVAPVAVAVLADLGLIDPAAVPRQATPPVLGGGRPVGSLRIARARDGA
jgi:L-asparaginase II